jgi:hypothetical protein
MFRDILAQLQELSKSTKRARILPSELTSLVRKRVPNSLIRYRTLRSRAVHLGQVLISGVYDCEEDAQGFACIEVCLNYNPEQKQLDTALIDWKQLSFDIAECIGHELVHRQQRRRRARTYISSLEPGPLKDEQEYLGSSDEIEAYGFSIAADLAVNHNSLNDINKTDMWKVYVNTFETDQSVLLELEQHVRKYYSKLKGGGHEQIRKQTNPRRRNPRA